MGRGRAISIPLHSGCDAGDGRQPGEAQARGLSGYRIAATYPRCPRYPQMVRMTFRYCRLACFGDSETLALAAWPRRSPACRARQPCAAPTGAIAWPLSRGACPQYSECTPRHDPGVHRCIDSSACLSRRRWRSWRRRARSARARRRYAENWCDRTGIRPRVRCFRRRRGRSCSSPSVRPSRTTGGMMEKQFQSVTVPNTRATFFDSVRVEDRFTR